MTATVKKESTALVSDIYAIYEEGSDGAVRFPIVHGGYVKYTFVEYLLELVSKGYKIKV